MSEGTPNPQINVSKIPGGGGFAGFLFAVISMLIFLIGIPSGHHFGLRDCACSSFDPARDPG